MPDYIRVSDMPERLAQPDAAPLWVAAAYEPDPHGKLTVARPVASVVRDGANPGEWIVTYAVEYRGCRKAVRMAGDRWLYVVETQTLSSPDGTLVAVVPTTAGCQWSAACGNRAVMVLPHPDGSRAVPVCEPCKDRADRLR